MTGIEVFKEMCMELHKESDKSYETVVLAMLKTKYRNLLPDDLEIQDIAYILNIKQKIVSSMLRRILGTTCSTTDKVHKSRLRVLAQQRQDLKEYLEDDRIIQDDIEHEQVR